MISKLKVMEINSVYAACGVIEGFPPFEYTNKDVIEGWAYLIRTGDCWRLQGFYGRGAADYINSGLISKEGVINWDKFDELMEE